MVWVNIGPSSWRHLKIRHEPAQQRQPAGAFPRDDGFEAFAYQRRAVSDAGQHGCFGQQIVVEIDRGAHNGLR